MRRAVFFVLTLACGGAAQPAHVEIVQPLPDPSARPVEAAPLPLPRAEASSDPADPRPPPHDSIDTLTARAASLESLLASMPPPNAAAAPVELVEAQTYVWLRELGDGSAGAKAIAHYEALKTRYPQFAKLDEAELGLGLEYMNADDPMAARRAFYELIKTRPQSTYVPYAYFAFGEMFQREAKSDPAKWDFAQQAYAEVKKYATSPIAPEAVCRLAEVATAQGDGARADAMRAALAREYPNAPATRRCGGNP